MWWVDLWLLRKAFVNILFLLGAFIFPFLIMMILEGMPLLLLELGIGQRLRQGSLGVWNVIHPYLGGIGLGSSVIAVIVACYYNMIIAWCFFYLGNSIRVSKNSDILFLIIIRSLYFLLYCSFLFYWRHFSICSSEIIFMYIDNGFLT